MGKLKKRDERAAKAYLRSVVITFDSRWTFENLERNARFRFRGLFAKTSLTKDEYAALQGVFIKEVMKLGERWKIVVSVHFANGDDEYIEQAEIISEQCKLQDIMPVFEATRDELKAAGNPKHFLYYTWQAEVYK